MTAAEAILRCPVCGGCVSFADSTLRCAAGHAFDRAAAGYVNLLAPGRMKNATAGDDAGMARARRDFLERDFYKSAADAAVRIFRDLKPRCVIDCGCGEGYYTAKLAEGTGADLVLGVDASKSAVTLAAKAAKRSPFAEHLFYVVGNLFSVPAADGCADAIFNMFAPVAAEEFHRLLAPGGTLVVGAAGKRHLFGLKEVLYDALYENEPRTEAPAGFALADVVSVTETITLPTQEDIQNLFKMTPYYYRTPEDGRARLARTDRLATEIAVDFYIYRSV